MSEPSTEPATAAPPVEWSIPRGLIVLLSLAAMVVTIAGLEAFSGVVGPVFLALMLTIAVQPIQTWAVRKGWPAWLGMAAALVAVVAICSESVVRWHCRRRSWPHCCPTMPTNSTGCSTMGATGCRVRG